MQEEDSADVREFEAFQQELEALETFRHQFRAHYGFASLERHDPDVQRLIEGMAFFTARTQGQARHAVARYELRALEELFPYLLSPMPSIALLAPEGAERLSDGTTIPVGTEFSLPVPARGNTPAREFRYRTLRTLSVHPLRIDRHGVSLSRGEDGSSKLGLVLRSHDPRHDDLREIQLWMDPQGDVLGAFRLYSALRDSLTRVTYEFSSTTSGPKAVESFAFGPPTEGASTEPLANPMERFRRFFHFPLMAMCLRLRVSAPLSDWTELRLTLHLSPRFPAGLGVGPGSFLLHAVPVLNLRREMADPVPYDGTKARVPVQHPEPELGYRPRELLGVYRSTPGGLLPILTEALAGTREHYAAEVSGEGSDRQVVLDVNLPRAFDEPTKIVSDVEFYQPLAAIPEGAELSLQPTARHIEGLEWRVVKPLQTAAESPISGKRERLHQLLRLTSQRDLTAASLVCLLNLLGAENDELFRAVVQRIESVQVSEGPMASSATGRRKTYAVELKGLPPSLRPVACLLGMQLPDLIATFCDEPHVSVRLVLPGHDPNEFLFG